MFPRSDSEFGGSYFDRAPERLVLEGYRRWTAGFDSGSVVPWEMAWTLYAELLGEAEARRALSELGFFIRTLRHCAVCPLRSFPFGSHHVCREECLTLGLIAGLQNDDEKTVTTCLGAVSCPLRCDEIEQAARIFADVLTEFRQVLLPIPHEAINDILTRPSRAKYH